MDTALKNAVRTGDVKTLESFIFKKNIDLGKPALKESNIYHMAAYFGQTDCLKKLLKYDGSHLYSKGVNDGNLLHYAAKKGHVKVVEYLLSINYYVSLKDIGGDNAYHLAAASGQLDCLKKLLQHNKSYIDAKGMNGETAIHKAARNGHVDIVKYLINANADLDVKCNFNKDCLDDATSKEVVKLIVTHKFKKFLDNNKNKKELRRIIRKKDNEGNNILHYIAEGDDNILYLTKALDLGISVDARNNEGSTALHLAISSGSIQNINILLEKGASVNLKNKHGETALTFAVESGNHEIIDRILEED